MTVWYETYIVPALIAINLHLLLEHGSKKPGVSTFSSSKTVPRSRGSLFKKEKGSDTSFNSSHELSRASNIVLLLPYRKEQ